MLGAHLEIMEEGEQKLCLVEPTLELTEEMEVQVQLQLLELMEDGEALEAEEGAEARVDGVVILEVRQEQMQVLVELVVMEAAAEQGEKEDVLIEALQEQEVQEVLAALEEAAEAVEAMVGLELLLQ